MLQKQSVIIKIFEYMRLISVFFALWMAFDKPSFASFYLLLYFVMPMTALLAIEGSFFRKISANYKGRATSLYQLQSAFFNFAIFVVSCVLFFSHAPIASQLTVIAIYTLFFVQSSCVHLWEYCHGAPRVNLWRFVGTVMLTTAIVLVLWLQLCS